MFLSDLISSFALDPKKYHARENPYEEYEKQ